MGVRTVLVVDASPLTARRVEEALHGSGYRAVVVQSAAEAEEVAAREEIAVLLSALVFPRGNGYDLGRQVKARHPEAVVFLLCGPFEVYSQDRARAAGVHERIPRPFTAESFRRQLEGVLGPLGGDEGQAGEGGGAAGGSPGGSSGGQAGPVSAPPGSTGGQAGSGGSPVSGGSPGSAGQPAPQHGSASVLSAPSGSFGSLAPPALPAPHVPAEEERLATFLPRSYPRATTAPPDPALIPVVERVVQEVLPEVLEAVLSAALHRSRAFQDLVELAVDMAVREQVQQQVQQVVERAVRERLAALSLPGIGGAGSGGQGSDGQGDGRAGG